MQINWNSFKIYNQDSRGIRFKFEDLCRQLFVNENVSGNKQFRYLHSNPNNKGLETEPVYDEKNSRWVGFQAKYFDGRAESSQYRQIEESAQKTVEEYFGKVDHVYLFCNQSLNSSSLDKTKKILEEAGISIELITNDMILDLVREKYSYLGVYYFGNCYLPQEWFVSHTENMIEQLGERYSKDFNIEVDAYFELSLFIHDQAGADYINRKKGELINKVDSHNYRSAKDRRYLAMLKETVEMIDDVDVETILISFDWFNKVINATRSYVDEYVIEYKALRAEKAEVGVILNDRGQPQEKKKEAETKFRKLESRLGEVRELLALLNMVKILGREKELLSGKVMNMCGVAGSGKSQLLAVKTKDLLLEDRAALLLLGGIYFSDNVIQEQIMSNLQLDYNFEELIDALETIGEKGNHIVPIFIDAINETWNRALWKNGLPLIIEKINQATMVKVVFSYRPEFRKDLFTKGMQQQIEDGSIVSVPVNGFAKNGIAAVREFLNHYDIPFASLRQFGFEVTNPLFLKLYCETYDGEEVTLPRLYEKIIEKTNDNIFEHLRLSEKGFSKDENVLKPLIRQIAEAIISRKSRYLDRTTLTGLSYWTEYGFSPAAFISQLLKEGFLHESCFGGGSSYYFAYDQMNDYYCAKVIFDKISKKEDVKKYLLESILEVNDGMLNGFGNVDIFINACALYAEKYGEECIDIIDAIEDKEDRHEIFARYVNSLQWRDIPADTFVALIRKYPCWPEDVFQMLIINSVKPNHSLNANFLHKLLSGYELNKRDYLWTIFINEMAFNHESRLIQLIERYNCGERIENKVETQTELLLTLLGWILTASNRWLRDYASKAMVEILKEHFSLCRPILDKFKDVNDPYVIQRLYGIVFGACCKRTRGDLEELAEFVYEKVFNKEKVYPDILLRDYARLIIERFMYENPGYNGIIDKGKIMPPYKSDPIPQLEEQHYQDQEFKGTKAWIVMSMKMEGMGMYGDFGRYVFQRALSSFDVNDKEIFNYALHYIFQVLGFREELFDDHDRNCGSYDRYLTAKTERIGKKYQWIAMYNILARVSDHSKMVDKWSGSGVSDLRFEGPWDPYVRDFDPTLNENFMKCVDAPVFSNLTEYERKGREENKEVDITNEEKVRQWREEKGAYLSTSKDNLLLVADDGQEWVCLTKFCDTGRKNLDIERLYIWTWLYAYFVNPEQAETLLEYSNASHPYISNDLASFHESYTIYNREYPWAPSCHDFEENAYVDAWINTGEVEMVIEKELDDITFGDEIEFQYRDEVREREKKRNIGRVLHATTDLMWEEEYDASKEDTILYSVPCAKLIETMCLKQLDADGFFYDSECKLAAFDTRFTQDERTVVVRKDILDAFLEKNGLRLIWITTAEKEIHAEDRSTESWSEWRGVYAYNGDCIEGEIYRTDIRM